MAAPGGVDSESGEHGTMHRGKYRKRRFGRQKFFRFGIPDHTAPLCYALSASSTLIGAAMTATQSPC